MSLLFFLILAVSAILAVVFYKKDEEAADGLQKRTLITFTIAFVSLILFVNSFGDSSDNKKNTESKTTSSKQVKTSESSSSESQSSSSSKNDGKVSPSLQQQINEDLLKILTEDQGFALGKLDPNGQPLPDGQTREPNDSFKWSLNISKMEYYDAGVNAIKVYFTEDAMNNLSKAEGLQVLQSAQNMASGVLLALSDSVEEQEKIEKDFTLDQAHYMKPFIVAVDNNGTEIARTGVWDNKFKAKDFR
ncbi:hypothetical protein [Leuconostoc lactis]|uniref:hypothetical protein n=1 Tax=Leuconostoc lactis TaxID=1246 RepID=UPI0022E08F03|nr:hypothetical protein [Leuconostoc lactis]